METRNAGTGNVTADQNSTINPSTTNTLGTNATQGKNRTTTQDGASLSPPGTQGQTQTGRNKVDGR